MRLQVLLFFLPVQVFSQLSVLNREQALYHPTSLDSVHAFISPYFSKPEPDSLYPGSWLKRKLLHEHVFVIRDSANRFHFTIDPLFHFQLGKDQEDSTGQNLYQNSRGFRVRGQIGKDFSFETSFLENQGRFNPYIDSFVQLHGVIPGMGRWKSFDTTDYDFAFSSGYFSWQMCKHFALTAGHGKHFVGEGYRSLLLSDNSFNYPFLRLSHFWGKWQYTNVYAMGMNLHSGGVQTPPNTERLFQKKPMAFHTLSWKPHRKFELGLFQGLIWTVSDTLNRLEMGAGYFLPVMFVAPVMYDLNTEKNVWLGINFRAEAAKGLFVYGQLVLDGSGSSVEQKKSGFQFGIKYLNAFTVKNLMLQLEYNLVNHFTYASPVVDQNISHYNQPLAHPLGAGFKEVVGIVDYKIKRFVLHGALIAAGHGQDVPGGNAGFFIWASDSTYNSSSFISVRSMNMNGYVGYLVNPSYNFQIAAGARIRQRQGDAFSQNSFEFFLALRTHLWNQYLDF
ncbi:MAG: hypothetical protein IT233_02785 [Bacteroidia bacterium]|nr:hypothetical protein [Bacteroidia bacterium]